MRLSWTIAHVRDIPIRLHASLLIVPLFVFMTFGAAHGASGIVFGLLLSAALFGSVVLHELGHSIAAQRYGVKVKEITLYPLGGIASFADMPRTPKQELWVAVAGPLVNVAIAGVLAVLALALGVELSPSVQPSLSAGLGWLIGANLTLAAFNMLPALPMDGGRVLRALLEMKLGRERATPIASAVAQLIAIPMGIYAVLSGQPMLAIIAVMVFFGAKAELVSDQTRSALAGHSAGSLYNRHALVLQPGDPVARVVELLLSSYQHDFAVVLGERVLGILSREQVMHALMSGERPPYVSSLMDRDFVRVDARTPAVELQKLLAEREARVAAVFDGERFLGLVSVEDLAEAAMVLSASRFGELRSPR